MNLFAKFLFSAKARRFVAILILAGFLFIAPQPSNAAIKVALVPIGGTVIFDMGWFGIPLIFVLPLGRLMLRTGAIIGFPGQTPTGQFMQLGCHPGFAILGIGIKASIRIKLGFIKIRISFTLPILAFCLFPANPPDMSGYPPQPTQKEMEEMIDDTDIGLCVPPEGRLPVAELPPVSGIRPDDRVKVVAPIASVRDRPLVQGTTLMGGQPRGAYGNIISREVLVTTEDLNPNAGGDIIPPSVPTQFTGISDSSSYGINLSWEPSTDNIGVAGYKIFRDGYVLAVPGEIFYKDINIVPNTSYSYTVVAVDAAGNISLPTGEVVITAPELDQAQGLRGVARGIGADKIQIAWTISDKTGVDGYNVYRNGRLIAILGAGDSVYEDSGLLRSTIYSYVMAARNINGTEFLYSNSFRAATLAVSTKFKRNDRIETTFDVNVRTSPSIMGISKGIQPQGTRGIVVSGPRYVDGYWWWGVNYDSGPSGWSAEPYLRFIDSTFPAQPVQPLFPVEPEPVFGLPPEIPPNSIEPPIDLTPSPTPAPNNNLRTYRWWQVDFDYASDGWVLEEDIVSVSTPYITIHCPDDYTILIDDSKTTLDIAYQFDGDLQAYNVTAVVFQLDNRTPERDVSIDDGVYQMGNVPNNTSHTLRAWLEGVGWPKIPHSEVIVNIKGMDYINSIDISPPKVSITSPADDAIVQGQVVITADASDNDGIAGVTFKIGAENIGFEDTTAPYSATWNTRTYANGQYAISAFARDVNDNETVTNIMVNVKNPKFAAGNRVFASTIASVYSEPSMTAKLAGTQQLNSGGAIVGASVEADNIIWWNVNFNTGIDGWVVENNLSLTTTDINASQRPPRITIPAPITTILPPSSKFKSGDWVYVSSAVNVYRDVTVPTPIVAGAQPQDASGYIMQKSVESDGKIWWRIDFKTGAYGWVEEQFLIPTFYISSPAGGSKVSGTINVTADAHSSSEVTKVQFKIDSKNFGTEDTSAPYTIALDTAQLKNGPHIIMAEGKKGLQVITMNATANVEVDNLKFSVGNKAYTSLPTSAKETPSFYATSTGFHDKNATGTVVSGPIEADDSRWWQINFDAGEDGWADDANLSAVPVWTLPPSENLQNSAEIAEANQTLTRKFMIGQSAYAPSAVEIRGAPALAARITGTQTGNAVGNIANGPVNADGSAWWIVDFKTGTDGWVEEQFLTPTFYISSPANNSKVSGVVNITASAHSSNGIIGVKFKTDGNILGVEDISAPFSVSWDTIKLLNGSHSIMAEGRSASGVKFIKFSSVEVANVKFAIGQRVSVPSAAMVKDAPSSDSATLGTQSHNSAGVVVEGPNKSADGFIWWKIDFTAGADGWVNETSLR